MHWQTARFLIDLTQPKVMGIVNVTPDSFSDGGQFLSPSAAMAQAERLLSDGADMIDFGAESTRPGARSPAPLEEIERLGPLLRLAPTLGVPVSVDTSTPEVMRAALDAGFDIVNDVRSLARPGALTTLATHPSAGVCLMHMSAEPARMQDDPHYGDVVDDVGAWLRQSMALVVAAGVSAQRVVLDPGIGFGKTLAHNLALLRRQDELLRLGRPLLVGWSRKSALGAITGRACGERVAASVAAALLAVQAGARVVRVHDVAPTVDALRVWRAVDETTGADGSDDHRRKR